MKTNVIKNRYEFMVLLEASFCNPNGDPDMDNSPRQDTDTGNGIITAVAIKRRIRNYVQDAVQDAQILMKSGTNTNRAIAEAVMAANGVDKLDGIKKGQNAAKSENWLCEKYWDVRTFGGVMSVGRNAGQVRGAVQIGMSTSVDPISIEDMTITRMCYTEGDYNTLKEFDDADAKMDEDKKRTMGSQKITPYGLYVVKGTVSACFAEKNGFTEDDLKLLWEAILQMYNHDASLSKEGMSVISPLIIFKHVGTNSADNDDKEREAKLGCAPAHMLYNLIAVKKRDDVEYPRKFEDYEVSFNASGVPNGVNVGFKYMPFSDVEWDTTNLKSVGIQVL